MNYSVKRQTELGPGFTSTPSALAQGLFAWYDQQWPGWRNEIDAQAVELALVDLIGDNNPRRVNPARLDALAEILIELRSQDPNAIRVLQEAVGEIGSSPKLPGIIQGIGTYFRTGLLLLDPEIRSARVGIFTDFFELLDPIVTRVFNRYIRKLDTRARDEQKKLVQMTEPEQHPAPSDPALTSSDHEEVHAAARNVLHQVEKEITAGAMKALRIYLGRIEEVTASEAARISGVSPATLTRALQTLQGISNREMNGLTPKSRLAFAKALYSVALA